MTTIEIMKTNIANATKARDAYRADKNEDTWTDYQDAIDAIDQDASCATTRPDVDRSTLSSLLVMGPKVPKHVSAYPDHDALVSAGYATKAPMGDDRFEYQITPAGVDYLMANKPAE